LLAAAREVFRDRGVAATLNDVAHHAGLGVGTAYRHFANKEALIDALFEDMVETVDRYLREAAEEPDAWLGLTRALQQVCEVQAFDRGLREVMLGTGRGPERQQQMRERVGPTVDVLVSRAQVIVSPGHQFGPAGVGHFRVCFARDEAQWEEAVGRMVTVLDALGQERGVA
jgi:AcrR family transcriptional regulator